MIGEKRETEKMERAMRWLEGRQKVEDDGKDKLMTGKETERAGSWLEIDGIK